jgi:hypothetical protein
MYIPDVEEFSQHYLQGKCTLLLGIEGSLTMSYTECVCTNHQIIKKSFGSKWNGQAEI